MQPAAAIEDGPPREDQPAENGNGRQDRRNWVTEKCGGSDSTSEGREVRRDVVDRRDKSLIHDVRDSKKRPQAKVTDRRTLTTVVVCPKPSGPTAPTRQVGLPRGPAMSRALRRGTNSAAS